MRRPVLARARAACAYALRVRARAACALALLALGVAGCTAGSGGGNATVTVSGNTLTIYASGAATDQPQVAQDVLDAEQLAFKQGPTRVGKFTLRFAVVHGSISGQARQVIQDSRAIAYLGEIVPHSSYASLGITNGGDVLQVTPTDTALELTQATPAVPGAPHSFYESLGTYGQTFARVVPTTAQEARAQVQEMQTLGVTKLYVADDGSPYGAAIAHAVRTDASGKITVVSSESGADGAFYGAISPPRAAAFFSALASANPSAKLFGSSSLDAPSFTGALSGSVRNLYISVPGFRSADLDPAGRKFVSDFTAAYGRAPVTQAIFGYEAMAAVLTVLQKAGSSANNRTTVVHDFISLKRNQSVLGAYSINSSGDTSIAPFVFNHFRNGKLVPVSSGQG